MFAYPCIGSDNFRGLSCDQDGLLLDLSCMLDSQVCLFRHGIDILEVAPAGRYVRGDPVVYGLCSPDSRNDSPSS